MIMYVDDAADDGDSDYDDNGVDDEFDDNDDDCDDDGSHFFVTIKYHGRHLIVPFM